MTLRALVIRAALSVLALALMTLFFVAVSAQTDPPTSGDWTVGDTTVVTDQVVDLKGNLTVTSGGSLTLRNVTLRVHSGITGGIKGVYVRSGGSLIITDGDADPTTLDDRTAVLRGVPSQGFEFVAERGASLQIRRSLVAGMGVYSGVSGLEILANGTIVSNSTIASGADYCVRVNGCSNVKLLNSTIAISDHVGLVLKDARGVEGRGCTVAINDGNGIEVRNSSSVMIAECNVSSNTLTGFRLYGGSNVTLMKCLISLESRGIQAEGTTNLTIRGCTIKSIDFTSVIIEKGADGIWFLDTVVRDVQQTCLDLDDVHNVTIEACSFENGSYYGVWIDNGASNISMKDTVIVDCGYDGLHVVGARSFTANYVGVARCGYTGMFFVESSGVALTECTSRDNGYEGFYWDNSANVTLTRCLGRGNIYHGARLEADTHDVVIQNSSFWGNSKAGLLLNAARNVTIVDCEFYSNVWFGVRLEDEAHHASIIDCRFDATNGGGLRALRGVSNVNVEGGTISAQGNDYAVEVDRSGDVVLANATIQGTLHAEGGGNLTLVSPRGSWDAIAIDNGSWVEVAWLLSVHVLWPDDEPVEDAVVNATNLDGARSSGTTDPEGWLRFLPVTVRTRTPGGWTEYNPISVTADKGGVTNGTTITLTFDRTLLIILQDIVPPLAVMDDIVAELGFETTLNGTNSTDNVGVKFWSWTFDDGVGIVQLEGGVVTWNFTRLGSFAGTLNVSDRAGLWNETSFTIHVVDTIAPEISLNNVTVPQGATVELNGTGAVDNDSTLLTTGLFRWSVLVKSTGSELGTREGPFKTWTFPEMGVYLVTANLTDQSGNTGTADFTVTVLDTTPPVVVAGSDLEVPEGARVAILAESASDNDPGFNVTGALWWVFTGPDHSLNLTGPDVLWLAPTMGQYTATLYARDAAGNTGSDTLTIIVWDATPPLAHIADVGPVEIGTLVNLNASGTMDNDPFFPVGARFRWNVTGPRLQLELQGAETSFTPPWIGEYVVILVVTDAAGNEGSGQLNILSRDTVGPEFLSFSPGPEELSNTTEVTIGFTVADWGTGIYPASLEYRVSLAGNESWSEWVEMGITTGGFEVSAGIVMALAEGTNRVQLRCHDQAGNGPVVSQEHPVRVNSRPVVIILSPVDGTEFYSSSSVVMDASPSYDPDEGDTLTFSWVSSIDGDLGDEIRRTVDGLTPGTHVITVTVWDGVTGHQVSDSVEIRVLPQPSTVDDDLPPWLLVLIVLLIIATVLSLAWALRRVRAEPVEDVEDLEQEEQAP
jgi:parallel beta-helix repeat protein